MEPGAIKASHTNFYMKDDLLYLKIYSDGKIVFDGQVSTTAESATRMIITDLICMQKKEIESLREQVNMQNEEIESLREQVNDERLKLDDVWMDFRALTCGTAELAERAQKLYNKVNEEQKNNE